MTAIKVTWISNLYEKMIKKNKYGRKKKRHERKWL